MASTHASATALIEQGLLGQLVPLARSLARLRRTRPRRPLNVCIPHDKIVSMIFPHEYRIYPSPEPITAQRQLSQQQKHVQNALKQLHLKQLNLKQLNLKQLHRVQRSHQRIERQQQNHYAQVTHTLVQRFDAIALEDFNSRGLAKTRLAKSILDASSGRFMTILEAVAVKCGLHGVKISHHDTAQNCSGCCANAPQTRSIRGRQSPHRGLARNRDEHVALGEHFASRLNNLSDPQHL